MLGGMAIPDYHGVVFDHLFFSLPVLRCPSVLQQRNLAIQFHLECVYINLTYYEYQSAKEHIRKAQELSGLNINMTGM